MPTKKQIITFGILCVIALGLGYWSGMPEEDSGQRAEVLAPTVVTNVVTNVLKEVVTNIVRVPTQQPARQKAKRPPAQEIVGGLPPPEAGDHLGYIASYDPKFHFYVVYSGANHGIKKGDEYNVIRAGNLVGKIKIQKTDPTTSIASAVKAFTPQRLIRGDKVIKANTVTADAMNPVIERAVRLEIQKPVGELTASDFEKVKALDLRDGGLTEVPRELEKFSQLGRLSFHNNKLTDVKGLAKFTNLWHLNLYRNNLTDVKGLENLTNLKMLILKENRYLRKTQIEQLQKALPNCRITYDSK